MLNTALIHLMEIHVIVIINIAFTLSLKSESGEVLIVPNYMGDALASLLKNEECPNICKWLPKASSRS